MSEPSKGSKKAIRLTEDELKVLQEFHSWGAACIRSISLLIDIPYEKARYIVRKLKTEGLIKPMGWLRRSSLEPGFGGYYQPVILTSTDVSGLTPRARGLDLRGPSFFRLSKSSMPKGQAEKNSAKLSGGDLYLPHHQFHSLLTAEWLAFCLQGSGTRYRISAEHILRFYRGWYGGGRPPRHPAPSLTMVPDFLVEIERGAFHVEVELSVKTKDTYLRDFIRLRPRLRPVLMVTFDETTHAAVRRNIAGLEADITVIQFEDTAALDRFMTKLQGSITDLP